MTARQAASCGSHIFPLRSSCNWQSIQVAICFSGRRIRKPKAVDLFALSSSAPCLGARPQGLETRWKDRDQASNDE